MSIELRKQLIAFCRENFDWSFNFNAPDRIILKAYYAILDKQS